MAIPNLDLPAFLLVNAASTANIALSFPRNLVTPEVKTGGPENSPSMARYRH
jgi:hypothetical protein